MQIMSLLVCMLLFVNIVCAHYIEDDLAEIKAGITNLRAICENKGVPKKRCKDGWVINQEACYFFGSSELSFAASQSFCVSLDNAHLANIETATENTFIRDYLRRMNATADLFWFGLTDEKTENVWRHFPSGVQATFLAWGPGEPNSGRFANCAAIWKAVDYMWVDDPCDRQMRPICEQQAQ